MEKDNEDKSEHNKFRLEGTVDVRDPQVGNDGSIENKSDMSTTPSVTDILKYEESLDIGTGKKLNTEGASVDVGNQPESKHVSNVTHNILNSGMCEEHNVMSSKNQGY